MNEEQLQEGRGSGLFTLKNLILLLVGIALGYFLKLQALQTVTIGYDDYKLSQWNQSLIGQKVKDGSRVSAPAATPSVTPAPTRKGESDEIDFDNKSKQSENKGQASEEKKKAEENK